MTEDLSSLPSLASWRKSRRKDRVDHRLGVREAASRRARLQESNAAPKPTSSGLVVVSVPTSRYAGLTFLEEEQRWEVAISHNGASQIVGRFVREDIAAWSYDEAVRAFYRDPRVELPGWKHFNLTGGDAAGAARAASRMGPLDAGLLPSCWL
jgi:hypothetical protein|tara:strand:- start:567 stop:1025 length:459 start_codon:yes stop_codon:yes gene_type:complete